MVYSISRSLPAPAPRAPPPHYQTFLTPLLHRRFAHASLISLGFCYVEAFLISDKSNPFWVILPISWTGVKCAVLFFLSAMPILILRIAQLHVVKRVNPSSFHTVQRSIGSFSTYTAIFTYLVSSVVFTVLYLLSSNDSDRLGIVIEGRSYERPRLNERFLYLMFFSAYIGVVQGVYHVVLDRARLQLPDIPVASYKDAAKKQLPLLGWNTGVLMAVTAVTGPFAYLPFRHLFWTYTLCIARQFYWLNRAAVLPTFPVGPGLFIRSAVIAFLTCVSSEVAHIAFTSFFVEDPFQSGKAISDKSSDPNGTLVTGLRSTKAPLTQSAAFWELDFLATSRQDRRRSIFADVGRSSQNMWEQILAECLRAVNEVEIKLTEILTPPALASTSAPAASRTPSTTVLSPPPIRMGQDNVLLSTKRSPVRNLVDIMQGPDGAASPSAVFRKHLALTESPDATKAQTSVISRMKEQISPLLASSWGKPFRQTVQRVTTAAIPNVRIPLDAISALGKLVVASLEEDEFGVVQAHVCKILQSFCTTLETLEKYVANPPMHWTDTEAKSGAPHLPEPELLIAQLRSTIADVTRAFSPFLDEMGLPKDVRSKLPAV